MSTRSLRSTLALDALYASGVASLVGGVSILLAANFAVQAMRAAPQVLVSPDSWSWLAKTEIGAQSLHVSEAAPIDAAAVLQKQNKATVDTEYQPLPQRRLAMRSLGRIFRKQPGVSRAVAHNRVKDLVNVAQASPIEVAPAMTEREALQNIHALLQGRFVAAVLNVAPETLFAAAPKHVSSHPAIAQTRTIAVVSHGHSSDNGASGIVPVRQDSIRNFEPIEKDINQVVAEIAASKAAQVHALSGRGTASSGGAKNWKRLSRHVTPPVAAVTPASMTIQSSRTALFGKVTEASNHPGASEPVANVNSQQAPPSAKPVKETVGIAAPIPAIDGGHAESLKPTSRIVTTQTQIAQNDIITATQARPEYSAAQPQAGYSKLVAPAGLNNPKPATSVRVAQAAPVPGLPGEPSGENNGNQLGLLSVPMAKTNPAGSNPLMMNDSPSISRECVEAFHWDQTVSFCDHRILTHEFADGSWVIVQAKEHWPTLYWKGARDITVPLISNNAGILLGRLAETTVQNEAGIVFGVVPAGWNVTISGRADQPVFLNAKNELVPGNAVDSERYFAFLNVEPGANVLYFHNSASNESGSVALPVINGSASYVDLSAITFKTVSGWVLDATTSRGLSQVAVTTIDQPVSGTSDSKGAFSIDRVAVVGDMPLYLETRVKDQYPHRYKVNPKQLSAVALYRFKLEMIDNWVGQIEGGVSAESALVVGALPQLTAKEEGKKLVTSVRTVLESQVLPPETYVLSPKGDVRLQSQISLSSSASRFLGVQVPAGPVIVGVKAEADGEHLWSELLLVSPRVISVVGPY